MPFATFSRNPLVSNRFTHFFHQPHYALSFYAPYFNNDRKPTLYEKDIAQWANKHQIFKSCDFADFSPRKGFKCKYYLKQLE